MLDDEISRPDQRIYRRFLEASTKVTGGILNNAFQEKALLEGEYRTWVEQKTAVFAKFERLSQEAVSTAVKAEAGVSAGLILPDSGKNKESMSFFDPVLKIQDQPRWFHWQSSA